MARGKKKEAALSMEEKLERALVPESEQPYPIPENWCWTRLNFIGQWGSGGTPSRKIPAFYEGEIPWIKTGELNDGYVYETEEHISEEALNKSSAKLFPVNTVAIAMYGATIGKVGIMGVEAATNQACACAISSPAVDYKYLFYYARSQKDAFIKKGKGGAQPNISQEIIKEHEIPLPPLSEQQRIVTRIEHLFAQLDEAKEKAQAVVDSFETRKAAILHKAFTGELTAKWRTEHGVEMDSWKNQTIGDVIKVSSGKGLTAKNMVSDGLIPVYGGNGVTGYHNESNVEPDTVVIGRVGFYCGSVHYISEPAWVTDNALIVSYKQEINKWYLVHLLRYADLRQNDSSTAQPVVSGSKIYPISIKIAPIDEQAEIVRILDSLFAKEQQAKEAAEAVLEKIDLLKKSILARAFRGELGTNDPTEESAIELLKSVL